jgi:NitT/TauT family transport system ATP-binding protein
MPDAASTLPASARRFVELTDVSLRYGGPGGIEALNNVSLTMASGEFVAVVGPSGCGKSSLMKLISGLERATEGSVIVDGQDVTSPLKIVGMAFQNPVMLPWRTTLKNIMLPLEIVQPHRARLSQERANYLKRADRLLRAVNLSGFEQRFPWQLSGGMQQRASLCRALIHEPRLMLLDEPFGALDAFTREELWDVMQTLWLEQRFTAMLVTHDLVESVYLADRVVVVSDRPGKVIYEKVVDLPRPRPPSIRYEPVFAEMMHEIREHIVFTRTQLTSGTTPSPKAAVS